MHRIGVMGGDGVGPELVAQGLRVLERLAELEGFRYELVSYPHSGAHFRKTGELISESTIEEIGTLDSLFFGAVGDPELPEATMERGLLLPLVESLDLGIGVRPATLYAERLTPLKGMSDGAIDMVIVRDTTEDCFVAPGGIVRKGTDDEVSIGLLVYTHKAVERTVRYAFELAARRRCRLSVVSQANAVPSHSIWPRTARQLAAEYPSVQLRELYPDVGAMVMVSEPDQLDVVVTTYWIGGILTDLIGAVVGGIGGIGSGRISTERGFGLFEPAHGSAPKYTGQNRVSPIATLRALTMLLYQIGETRSARRLERAIMTAVRSGQIPGVTTRSGIGTIEATDAVIAGLESAGDGADLPITVLGRAHELPA
jgi:3-isopropylmalate dehydrogenase